MRADCHTLAVEAETGICELTGLFSLYCDDSWFAQMVSAALPVETDIVALKASLYEDFRVEVPLIEWNGNKLIRVSVQGYNTHEDIDRLLTSLNVLL